jgi:hypothetical protein
MSISDLVPVLARERKYVLPLIGAGLCVEAGLPSGSALAEALRERSDLELAAPRGDFGSVCREVEQEAGLSALQKLAAEALGSMVPAPTPSLMAIAGCPSARILTTNYDEAIERSVEEIGKEPVRISVGEERVGDSPQEGQVFVIHLHGVIEKPGTMVMTTAQRNALLADDVYRSRLRSLLFRGRPLALGLRLSAEEAHLRAELRLFGSQLGGRAPIVVLPEDEVDEELRILAADRAIELYSCDSSQDYLEVRQCAQLLAPRQIDPTEVIASRAIGIPTPFLEPPLTRPQEPPATGEEPARKRALLEESPGSEAELGEMSEAGRSLLIGAPGRGKTTALRRLGEKNRGRAVRCDLRNLRPSPAVPENAFARLVARDGEAFDQETPVPSKEALREGSFLFLLDGLEEARIEDHPLLVEAILEAAERWPQHSYVVATRPTSEAQRLLDAGFNKFIVESTEAWGKRYLEACGIAPEQIERLYDLVPTIGPQIAIPRYVARIAEELHDETEEVELAGGALERLVRGERKNLQEAAQRLGVEPDELMEWARRLAMILELRGKTSASMDEIAALPGPGGRDSRVTCDELVQAALLQDLPDRARFSAQISQEALCADTILRSEDPLAVLRKVAMAEVDGCLVFRDDIEHTIDLVFEGAPAALRTPLRELDELRWARTQRSEDAKAVAEAIDVIWGWHRKKRLWIRYRGDNQLRGPGEALRALHRAAPEVLESRRATLNAECRHEEPTIRSNALEILTLLPADEGTESILRELLADPDGVVRTRAAHAIEHFRLTSLTAELWAAWEEEEDESALRAIGLALGALCEERELRESISLLRQKGEGWMRIYRRIFGRISLPVVAELFSSGSLYPLDALDALDVRIERDEPFSAAEAEALGRILVRVGMRAYEEAERFEQIRKLVAAHPEEVLAGAREGADDKTKGVEMFWAYELDSDLLMRWAEGPLADPIEELLEQAGQHEQNANAKPDPPARQKRVPDLATLLAHGAVGEEKVPLPWLMNLSREPKEVQERLLELAETWYRKGAATPTVGDDGRRILTPGFCGAVLTWEALDHPVSAERWLEILGAGMERRRSHSGHIARWMSRHWREECSKEAAERVRALRDPADLTEAANAIPDWSPELRGLFVQTACRLDEDSLSSTIVDRLREFGDVGQLREIVAAECGQSTREMALVALAHLGDVCAQRRLLEAMLEQIDEGEVSYSRDEPKWLGSISSPALVEPLGRLLRATHRRDEASKLRRMVETAIRSIGHDSCLRLYDDLVADPDLEGGQFYWYQREALARSLARQEVLARLSEHGSPLHALQEGIRDGAPRTRT